MTVHYHGVHWNRQKKIYDRTLVGGLLLVIGTFVAVTAVLRPELTAETLLIRGTSITALVLLHFVLAIGPLMSIFLPHYDLGPLQDPGESSSRVPSSEP